jgi:hypothetical protein
MVFMAISFWTAAEVYVPPVILLAEAPSVLAPNQTVRLEPICGADAVVSHLSGWIGYAAPMTVTGRRTGPIEIPPTGATSSRNLPNGAIMYRTLVLAALAGMIAGPALAAGGSCSTAPKSQFKPKATLEAQLTGEGLTVRQIKVEKGCYEVYAVDKAGKKVNLAYNAETLEKLDNAEAGEN